MGTFYTSYYGLTRVNSAGPESKDWAVTDSNWQTTSLIMHTLEQHVHGAATPIKYPGYNFATPATPIRPALTEQSDSTDGFLSPGTLVGVRLAYRNAVGLETDGSPESTVILSAVPARANTPQASVPVATPVPGGVGGGTYVYGMTKRKGNGETQISNTVAIDVPFSVTGSYYVPLSFDPGNTYASDSIDSLRIYRATGYNAQFQLVKTITDMNTAAFNDSNAIEGPTTAPPAINTMGKNKRVLIDWSAISHPAEAEGMRVYVTQQSGIYGVNQLLADYDMSDPSTPIPTTMYYKGSETLTKGYPQDFTQLVGSPPKLNLRYEATGAPWLTTDMNFQGFQAQKFVLGDQNWSTPLPGNVYFDKSTQTVKFYFNGGYQTLATPGLGNFVHATAEPGGHNAANILYPAAGGTTVKTVLDVIATPVANFRKQVQTVTKATATPVNLTTGSSAAAYIADMDSGLINPSFAGQWHEVIFNGAFYHPTFGATTSVQLEIDGSSTAGAETVRSWTATATPSQGVLTFYFATPITKSNTRFKVQWWSSIGTATSIGGRRTLVVKQVF